MKERLEKEKELYGISSPNIKSMERRRGGLVVFKTEKEEIIFSKEGKIVSCPSKERRYLKN